MKREKSRSLVQHWNFPCVRICRFPRRSASGSIHRVQATQQKHRGAFLFGVLLLLVLDVSLHAQPAGPASTLNSQLSTHRVLELDGTNSFVELPLGAFTTLDEVTVEGWVKWESFGNYSRFFDLTLAGYTLVAADGATSPDLVAAAFRGDDLILAQAPGMLSTGSWIHVAVTSGKQGLKLFANGALVTTNLLRGTIPTETMEKRNYLGRSNLQGAGGGFVPDFHGQMAEVRLWRGERTEAQVRENLFKNLTGKEEGLAGLWNFADGTANDSSPGAHHGKLMGQARVVEATLPSATTVVPWSRLVVQVTDANGVPVQNPTVRAEVNGTVAGRAEGDTVGVAPLTIWTTAPTVDLFASSTNDLGGWRLAVPIIPYTVRTNAWKLGPATHIAGHAVALDGKTPHASLVVELVQPDGEPGSTGASPVPPGAPPGGTGAITATANVSRSENSPTAVPVGEGADRSGRGARAPQLPAAGTNRVLQLDGKGSYVELPSGSFSNLTEITVEGWVNWASFQPNSHFFEFGGTDAIYVLSEDNRPDLDLATRRNNVMVHSQVPGVLATNQWRHVAAVVSQTSQQLYLDGILVLNLTDTNRFASLLDDPKNFLGACVNRGSPGSGADFDGQMDEVRVWRTHRTAGQIRENMGRKLTGTEPDLVGLWNFDDPANPGRDSSPGAHHGKLIGQATVTNVALPLILSGNITDAAGKPLANATVEIHQSGQSDRVVAADAAGEYAFTITSTARCDLFVSNRELYSARP